MGKEKVKQNMYLQRGHKYQSAKKAHEKYILMYSLTERENVILGGGARDLAVQLHGFGPCPIYGF
jgi:hypothetical protein